MTKSTLSLDNMMNLIYKDLFDCSNNVVNAEKNLKKLLTTLRKADHFDEEERNNLKRMLVRYFETSISIRRQIDNIEPLLIELSQISYTPK